MAVDGEALKDQVGKYLYFRVADNGATFWAKLQEVVTEETDDPYVRYGPDAETGSTQSAMTLDSFDWISDHPGGPEGREHEEAQAKGDEVEHSQGGEPDVNEDEDVVLPRKRLTSTSKAAR